MINRTFLVLFKCIFPDDEYVLGYFQELFECPLIWCRFDATYAGEIIEEETQRAEIDQNALQRQGRVEYGILNEVNYSSGLEYDAPSTVWNCFDFLWRWFRFRFVFVCVRQMRVGVTWRCVQRAESSFSSWPGGSQRTAVRPWSPTTDTTEPRRTHSE